ncbi:vesicle transport protein, Got1/SFT2-like, partial [Kipferlia bialata]
LFFLDRGFLAMGNLLFLTGVYLLIGWQRAKALFFQKGRLLPSLAFFGGIVLIMCRWVLVGLIIEGLGFISLFGKFAGVLFLIMSRLPIIGPVFRLPIFQKAQMPFQKKRQEQMV